jgi:hypothetical protein
MATEAASSAVNEPSSSAQTRLYYRWSIVSKPPNSRLDAHDLWSSRTPEVSFLPDAPGEYVLCFKIFHRGKATTEQIRIFVEDAQDADEPLSAGGGVPLSMVGASLGTHLERERLGSGDAEEVVGALSQDTQVQNPLDARLRIRLNRSAV